MAIQNDPDQLKPLDALLLADPRSDNQSILDIFQPGANAVEVHHSNVLNIRLTDGVPTPIAVQFETAKNLYLYAWFVYRFFPVAEHHALTCLELGLKTRFPTLPKQYWNNSSNFGPTLRPLLKYAVDTGSIKNERFRQWQDQVAFRARQRYSAAQRQEMEEKNLDRIELDYSKAEPNDDDRNWDYLPILLEVLPGIRNSYAHGSTNLHNQVLGTLELVAEILNQLYENVQQSFQT